MTHPFPKAILVISLKLAFLPSSPGRIPACVAHLLRQYSPKAAVIADSAQDSAPGTRPIAENAAGKASAPAPMVVFARLTIEEKTVPVGSGLATDFAGVACPAGGGLRREEAGVAGGVAP